MILFSLFTREHCTFSNRQGFVAPNERKTFKLLRIVPEKCVLSPSHLYSILVYVFILEDRGFLVDSAVLVHVLFILLQRKWAQKCSSACIKFAKRRHGVAFLSLPFVGSELQLSLLNFGTLPAELCHRPLFIQRQWRSVESGFPGGALRAWETM